MSDERSRQWNFEAPPAARAPRKLNRASLYVDVLTDFLASEGRPEVTVTLADKKPETVFAGLYRAAKDDRFKDGDGNPLVKVSLIQGVPVITRLKS